MRCAAELAIHPLRGAIFANYVVTELRKWHRHGGLVPRMSFYRDRAGLEVDCVVEAGPVCHAVEIKSGGTVAAGFLAGLEAFGRLRRSAHLVLVCGGAERQERTSGLVLPWSELHTVAWN